ncbi:MAG: glycosyltransferase family 4 protein [Planctomycetes bacterium]|nr:glycosyltransferase family 4 protein [Planctomycetota bacterium]
MTDTGRQNARDSGTSSANRRDTTRVQKQRDTGRLRGRASQPWKVALFAPGLDLNGVTMATLNLASVLVAGGSQVLLVSPGGAMRQAAATAATRWLEIPAGRLGFFARRDFRAELGEFAPEILHAVVPNHSAPAVYAANQLDRPLVVSVLGLKGHELPDVGDTTYDAYVAVDHAVRERLLNDCRLERDRTTLLPMFVRPTRPPVEREIMDPRKQPVIGFVSPLHAGCGYREFVEAAMRVLGRGVDCMFAVLGDGPEGQAVRDMVEERGMQQRIVFVQNMYDYGRIWEPFDVVVIDSRQPASGVMVLQGMAHGLPVVATEGGAVFDIIDDGVDGLIVPRQDASALAERMLLLVQNPSERLRMARAAYAKIDQAYDAEAMAAAWGAIYAATAVHEPLPRAFDNIRSMRSTRRVN